MVIHLQQICKWISEGTCEVEPDATNWGKVVTIAQAEFRNVTIAEEYMRQMVVLIMKRYRR